MCTTTVCMYLGCSSVVGALIFANVAVLALLPGRLEARVWCPARALSFVSGVRAAPGWIVRGPLPDIAHALLQNKRRVGSVVVVANRLYRLFSL